MKSLKQYITEEYEQKSISNVKVIFDVKPEEIDYINTMIRPMD